MATYPTPTSIKVFTFFSSVSQEPFKIRYHDLHTMRDNVIILRPRTNPSAKRAFNKYLWSE